jgi:CRP-like cAMP-binding protein
VKNRADPDHFPRLAQFSLFRDLAADEAERLAALVRERRYGKGEIVFQKGDQPTGLYLVVAGLIKEACQSPQGGEKIIELVETGQAFGEAALFLDDPYPYSATALTDTVLWHLDRQVIHDLVSRHPAFVNRMVMALSGRVFALMRDVEACTVQNPIQRVACYLLSKCEDKAAKRASIVLPATKQAVASRLGMTPEALSRILRDFVDAALIDVQGNRIDVHDVDRLQTFTY